MNINRSPQGLRVSTNQTVTRTTPGTSFGDKLADASATDAGLLAQMDAVHQKMRSAVSPRELGALLDHYALLVAIRARKRGQTAAIPGAAILSAAIAAAGNATTPSRSASARNSAGG